MKLKLTRAYSQKKQIKQFEPIESFCSVEAEVDVKKIDDAEEISGLLDKFVRAEVEKTIEDIIPKPYFAGVKSKDVGREGAELDTILIMPELPAGTIDFGDDK